MLQNLKKNDRVVTIGGIYGTVVNAQKDLDEVTIKVDESTNTKLRMQRSRDCPRARVRRRCADEDRVIVHTYPDPHDYPSRELGSSCHA